MNLPSLRKFAPRVAPGGLLLVNTSLLGDETAGPDRHRRTAGCPAPSWRPRAATTSWSASSRSARWSAVWAGSRPSRSGPPSGRWSARSGLRSSRPTWACSRPGSRRAAWSPRLGSSGVGPAWIPAPVRRRSPLRMNRGLLRGPGSVSAAVARAPALAVTGCRPSPGESASSGAGPPRHAATRPRGCPPCRSAGRSDLRSGRRR